MAVFVDVFSILAFILTVISIIFINGTAYIFWMNRELTLIRFRWPLSYLIWSILVDLYFATRIIYLFGEVYGFYTLSDDTPLSITIHVIRGMGLNGSFLILFCRIWLFYYTYAYDQHMLEFRDNTNSWIIRYRNKFGNEEFMLFTVFAIFLIFSIFVVLEETVLNDYIDGFTQIYSGLAFLCFIVLACFIPRKHDQLGLWTETVCYFILAGIAFIYLLAIQFTLKDTKKRVASYFGATCAFFSVNFISFYITIIYYEGYKYIFNGRYDKDIHGNEFEINNTYLELAKIVTHKRTYTAFRKFLADIFCVENLDFVAIVQYYRGYALHGTSAQIVKHSPKLSRTLATKSQEQIISDLFVENDANGQKAIDITRLQLNFVNIPLELKQLNDIKLWNQWIFNHYVSNESEHSLNLSSKMRKYYIKKYEKLHTKSNEVNQQMIEMENVKEEMSKFYDAAQTEIWKLMAQDSMVIFEILKFIHKQCGKAPNKMAQILLYIYKCLNLS